MDEDLPALSIGQLLVLQFFIFLDLTESFFSSFENLRLNKCISLSIFLHIKLSVQLQAFLSILFLLLKLFDDKLCFFLLKYKGVPQGR